MKNITEKLKSVLLARLKTTWIAAATRKTKDTGGTNDWKKKQQTNRAIG